MFPEGEGAIMSERTTRARTALKALADSDLPLYESFFSPDYVFHSQLDGKPSGRSGLGDRAVLLTSALHEAQLSVEMVLEDGDLVACRWRGRAVHGGDLLSVRATGRPVETTGITIFRFAGDLIVEEWTEFDGLGLLAQLTRPVDPARARKSRSKPFGSG